MPRKTRGIGLPRSARGGASMRPRPDAAENPHVLRFVDVIDRGWLQ